MKKEQMKNTFVIKNIPSNIIEEAIIVLKKNQVKDNIEVLKQIEKDKRIEKESIMEEATFIVNDYLSKTEDKKIIKKYKKLKKKYFLLKYINIGLLISITILLFVK